ncbi:hypothetical protein ACA910_017605 [Epithemia clementina (nom. ined.)]
MVPKQQATSTPTTIATTTTTTTTGSSRLFCRTPSSQSSPSSPPSSYGYPPPELSQPQLPQPPQQHRFLSQELEQQQKLLALDLSGPVDSLPGRRGGGVHHNNKKQSDPDIQQHDDNDNDDKDNDDDDNVQVTPLSQYCCQLLVQVGLTSLVLAWYLYMAMVQSSLYWIGLIAALGIGMIVQGLWRHWSWHHIQSLYNHQNNHHKNHNNTNTNTTTDVESSPTTHVVQGIVLQRFTQGWDPETAITMTPCTNAAQLQYCNGGGGGGGDDGIMPTSYFCTADTTHGHHHHPNPMIPTTEPQQRQQQNQQHQQYPPSCHYTHFADYDNNNVDGPESPHDASPASLILGGSWHTLVVQYHALVPQGYLRRDGHAVQTNGVQCRVVKEFTKVHPELYYSTRVYQPPTQQQQEQQQHNPKYYQQQHPNPQCAAETLDNNTNTPAAATDQEGGGEPAGKYYHGYNPLSPPPHYGNTTASTTTTPFVDIIHRADEPKSGYPLRLLLQQQRLGTTDDDEYYAPAVDHGLGNGDGGRIVMGFLVLVLAAVCSTLVWPWSSADVTALRTNVVVWIAVAGLVSYRARRKHDQFLSGEAHRARITAWMPRTCRSSSSSSSAAPVPLLPPTAVVAAAEPPRPHPLAYSKDQNHEDAMRASYNSQPHYLSQPTPVTAAAEYAYWAKPQKVLHPILQHHHHHHTNKNHFSCGVEQPQPKLLQQPQQQQQQPPSKQPLQSQSQPRTLPFVSSV